MDHLRGGEAQAFAQVFSRHAGTFAEGEYSGGNGCDALFIRFRDTPVVDLFEHQTEKFHLG